MRPLLAALAVSAAFSAGPAVAELKVETVNIERKTAAVDIEVAYPKTGNPVIDKLFADWANDMVAGFEKSADEDFASFKQDNGGEAPPWTYSLYLTFEVPRNDAGMFVVDFDESIFTGGAHPNHDIETFNFMMPDAWQVYLPEIFAGKPALEKISALAIADLERQFDQSRFDERSRLAEVGRGSILVEFPGLPAPPRHARHPLPALSGRGLCGRRPEGRDPVVGPRRPDAGRLADAGRLLRLPEGRDRDREVDLLRRGACPPRPGSGRFVYAGAVLGERRRGQKTKIRDAQRKWIGTRNACGGDVACLTAAYDARLKALQPG